MLHSVFLQLGLNSETSVVSALIHYSVLQDVDGDKSAAIFPMSPQVGQRMARIQVVTLLARATRTTCVEEKASSLLTTGLGR